ncbi:hypothetical protein AUC69_15185 [Methyloceanibacter superfactus]|uniref:Uncharacterized protein n=1 Tax=Methyloceanibacter superfactus TaxID=1774969 RepID=A0A1E3VRF1_9HYPH|nr:hypothetical protein AUC69_15185 [Methyloceanibacter superfactus]
MIATIAVAKNTPIRDDTQVNVEQQGLTGGIAVTLTGGLSTTPLPTDGGVPTLIAPPGAARTGRKARAMRSSRSRRSSIRMPRP